jgi:hypothetical protein
VAPQYQQDIQTKLRPGEFADRMDDKPARLAAAPDWQTVLRLFVELGDNTDRCAWCCGAVSCYVN